MSAAGASSETAGFGGAPEEAGRNKAPRTPNFNEWEDVTLGRSFSNASCDPILGNNQRGNAFWRKVTELYCVAHHLTDYSVSNTLHTRSLDQLKNRFKIITKELGIFHTHYNHIVQENPSGVPEEEYIALASDRFKEVEGRKFKFQKVFPILQDVVKYSVVDVGVPTLHEGLLDHHAGLPGTNTVAVNPGVVDTLGPREVVVTPVNPSRVNMAGSVMGSHLVRPMGSRRAKAAAAATREATRYGTPVAGTPVAAVQEPEVVVVPPPPGAPPKGMASDIADNLTMFLGTIFRDGKKKDQFDTRYKCWKVLVHHREEAKAERVKEELLTYMEPLQQEQEEEHQEEEEQVVLAATGEEDPEAPPTGAMLDDEEEQSVNLLDSGGEEHEEQQQQGGEEDNSTAGEDDDDDSETLVPPPPKPALAPILPLYTNKAPFNKPLRGNRRPLQHKNLNNRNLLPQKRAANKTTPPSEEGNDIDTQALMDFSTQALVNATSNFTDRRLPPPP